MATKTRLLKFLQEIHGYAEITNRRPAPRPPVLYLMALRLHPGETAAPKRKLTIPVLHKSSPDVPSPVKITRFKAGECPLPVVIG